ncbi:MAG: RtcB family protein [Planctomycetota bacterium]
MRKKQPKASVRSWASERLSSEIQRSLDRLARSDDVQHVAVMPDVHLGRDVCVGTAFATRALLYPDAIGGDIGCGMSAVALDASRSNLSPGVARELHHAIQRVVPVHRQKSTVPNTTTDQVPSPDELSLPPLRSFAKAEAPRQLGTLGTGNHFLELQYDTAEDQLWLMVHSGSRGLGQAIRAAHMEHTNRSKTGLAHLDIETPAGQDYLHDMQWARYFASTNRRAMLDAVAVATANLFGWYVLDESLLECDHNHIREEEHFGTAMFIHRKGAMSAHRDEPGVVPGSMATPSFHVVGRGVPEALCSSAHGAGRAMSRSEARSRISRARLIQELEDVHVDPRAIHNLREEAPSAYKDIHTVMNAQRKLVRVRRTLYPILTHKGLGS